MADVRAQAAADVAALESQLAAARGDIGTARDSAAAQRAQFEDQLAALRAEMAADRSQAESDLAAAEGRVAAAQQAASAAEAQAADLQESLAAARVETSEKASALDAVEARIAAMEAALARANEARSGLENRLNAALEAGSAADALKRDKAALEENLAAAETAAETSARRIAEMEQKLVALETALTRAKDSLASSDAAAAEKVGSLERQLAEALAAKKAAEAEAMDRDELQKRLASALAAKLAAEEQAGERLSEAEQREILLRQAQQQLSAEETKSAESQRRAALLNQQVAALRSQLSSLQALLDDAKERDAASQVELAALGKDLNTALARVAAEERKRRQLEEAERKRLEVEKKNLEKYRSEFFGRMRDVLGNRDGVKIVGDRFVFSSEVLFAPGKAELSAEGRSEIAKVADLIRGVADEIPEGIDWVLRVDGHTDDVPLSGNGEFRDNWELSQARALSVVRYMTDFLGLPPDRLSANGFGQYQPIAPGTSEEARAQNRRIELKFTEK